MCPIFRQYNDSFSYICFDRFSVYVHVRKKNNPCDHFCTPLIIRRYYNRYHSSGVNKNSINENDSSPFRRQTVLTLGLLCILCLFHGALLSNCTVYTKMPYLQEVGMYIINSLYKLLFDLLIWRPSSNVYITFLLLDVVNPFLYYTCM